MILTDPDTIALAREQVDRYGQRDWEPAFPALDASGQAIVYRDSFSGHRYTIALRFDDGRHVRIENGGRVCGFAPSFAEAEALVREVAAQHPDWELVPDGGGQRSNGSWFVRYRYPRMPLD